MTNRIAIEEQKVEIRRLETELFEAKAGLRELLVRLICGATGTIGIRRGICDLPVEHTGKHEDHFLREVFSWAR